MGKSAYQTDSDSALLLLGHRYYDPSIGRFLSSDPAQAGGNWYDYCGNNPLVWIDPNGLQIAVPPNFPPDQSGEWWWRNRQWVRGPEKGPIDGESRYNNRWRWHPADTDHDDHWDVRYNKKEWHVPANDDNDLDNDTPGSVTWEPKKSGGEGGSGGGSGSSNVRKIILVADALLLIADIVCCFDGDTLVLMADGSLKPIRKIVGGEEVIGYSNSTHTLTLENVLCATTSVCSQKAIVTFANGERIITTPNHLFYIFGIGFRSASKLCKGSRCELTSGKSFFIRSVHLETCHSRTVYNLIVNGSHDYFVGKSGILVHDQTNLVDLRHYKNGVKMK